MEIKKTIVRDRALYCLAELINTTETARFIDPLISVESVLRIIRKHLSAEDQRAIQDMYTESHYSVCRNCQCKKNSSG